MDGAGEQDGTIGAETSRRLAVLRPLVEAHLAGAAGLESGIRDAVWELGVSRATVWRWIRRLAEEGGRTSALVPRKRGRRVAIAAAQSRPLLKAAMFSTGIDDFAYAALLRTYEKEPRLLATIGRIVERSRRMALPPEAEFHN